MPDLAQSSEGVAIWMTFKSLWTIFLMHWSYIVHLYDHYIQKTTLIRCIEVHEFVFETRKLALIDILFIFALFIYFYSVFIHNTYVLLINSVLYTFSILCCVIAIGGWALFWLRQVPALSRSTDSTVIEPTRAIQESKQCTTPSRGKGVVIWWVVCP